MRGMGAELAAGCEAGGAETVSTMVLADGGGAVRRLVNAALRATNTGGSSVSPNRKMTENHSDGLCGGAVSVPGSFVTSRPR